MLVLSTLPVDNATTGEKKAAAALHFFDTRANTLIAGTLVPVPKARCTGPVLAVGGSRVLGWTENPEDLKGSAASSIFKSPS